MIGPGGGLRIRAQRLKTAETGTGIPLPSLAPPSLRQRLRNYRLAVEIDGGTWNNGRHTRPAGYAEDCDKLNTAALMGWTVLRFTGEHVRQGQAFAVVAEALRVASRRSSG